MSEVQVEFTVPGTLKIYGLLREVENAPIIVFVHGLGGSIDEHLHYNGARGVEEAGFAALRVSLYGNELDSRNLIDCTVDTHVDDVELVLRSLRTLNPDRHIGLVGHSLGGLVVQRVERSLFDAAVLWDPVDASFQHFSQWPEAEFSELLDLWVMHWGFEVLVSKDLERSWWQAEPDNHNLNWPTKIIGGGESWLGRDVLQRYATAQTGPSELVVIEGADHNFRVGEAANKLHAETINWFKQHLLLV